VLTKGLRQGLFDRIWSAGVRIRDVSKRLGISGPVEPLLTYLGPRLMPTPNKEMRLTMPEGHQLWVPPRFTSYRSYHLGLYERDLCRLLPSLITPGMTVLDVGANIGFFTIPMSRLVGSDGAVFAFEVDEGAAVLLARNLAANECSNVTIVRAAVADREGSLAFVPDGFDRGYIDWSSADRNPKAVPSITLDTYFEKLNWPAVDLVKLDIEGSEWAALAGMRRLCERNPAMKIVVELNQETIRRAGGTERQLLDQLKSLGFDHGRVIERGLKPFSLDKNLFTGGAMYNLLLDREPFSPD
jgi:FkbM family methyltransferase